jgi:pyruvate, water dikinase
MFTLNPASPSSIVIDASWGSGSAVVRGEVTPDSYVVSKATGELQLTDIGAKEVEYTRGSMREVDENRRRRRCLDRGELEQLADLGRRVEQHYEKPQEVEWAFEGDDLFLLHWRPETVWARKPRVVLPFE